MIQKTKRGVAICTPFFYQIIRGALFAAVHSEEFRNLLKPYEKNDVPLPSPSWTLQNHAYWLEQCPERKRRTSMFNAEETQKLQRLLEVLSEDNQKDVQKQKLDVSNRLRDERGRLLPHESKSETRVELPLRSIRLVKVKGTYGTYLVKDWESIERAAGAISLIGLLGVLSAIIFKRIILRLLLLKCPFALILFFSCLLPLSFSPSPSFLPFPPLLRFLLHL